METLVRYATPEQQEAVAEAVAGQRNPLVLRDDPEPAVACVRRDQYRGADRARGQPRIMSSTPANGGPAGAMDPRCKIIILMGKTDPQRAAPPAAIDDHRPARHAGRHRRCRPLTVFGYDGFAPLAMPRSSSRMSACRPKTSSSARARVRDQRRAAPGRGRIHHCMRHDRPRRAARSRRWSRGSRAASAFGHARRPGRHPRMDRRPRGWRSSRRACLTLKAAHMMDTVWQQGRPGRRSR